MPSNVSWEDTGDVVWHDTGDVVWQDGVAPPTVTVGANIIGGSGFYYFYSRQARLRRNCGDRIKR